MSSPATVGVDDDPHHGWQKGAKRKRLGSFRKGGLEWKPQVGMVLVCFSVFFPEGFLCNQPRTKIQRPRWKEKMKNGGYPAYGSAVCH